MPLTKPEIIAMLEASAKRTVEANAISAAASVKDTAEPADLAPRNITTTQTVLTGATQRQR